MHLPEPLDTTIAHKAINLTDELTSAEKAVAGAIIDHFNRKTGQCDPGLDRLARLLSLNRRTVLRAVEHLHDLRLIRKGRHGGHQNKNDYSPDWLRFREMDAAWSERFNGSKRAATNVSREKRQTSHKDGGAAVTQTSPKNQFIEPSPSASRKQRGPHDLGRCDRLAGKENRWVGHSARRLNSSQEAAAVEAERRWTSDVHREFCSSPEAYGAIIEVIGEELRAAATEAERQRRGGGLRLILDRVRVGGPRSLSTNTSGPASVVRSQGAENE